MGCRLGIELPHARLAILDAGEAIGGTWALFRYPGVRSDPDMTMLGFPFRPWPANHLRDRPAFRFARLRDPALRYDEA